MARPTLERRVDTKAPDIAATQISAISRRGLGQHVGRALLTVARQGSVADKVLASPEFPHIEAGSLGIDEGQDSEARPTASGFGTNFAHGIVTVAHHEQGAAVAHLSQAIQVHRGRVEHVLVADLVATPQVHAGIVVRQLERIEPFGDG